MRALASSAAALALASLAWAAPASVKPKTAPRARPVAIETADGWTLAGLYHPPKKGGPVAVLAHGVGASKEEWGGLCPKLWKRGFGTLAIDLRGHGGSTRGPRGTETFVDFDARGEWPKAERDLLAAARWLKARGIPISRVGFIGGSIGANLASQAAVETGARWAALLSPGFDYRGAKLADVSGLKACVGASPGDPYAFQTAVSLAQSAVFLQASHGHGAQMLEDPVFTGKLLDCVTRAAAR